jgi:hypothetical protein
MYTINPKKGCIFFKYIRRNSIVGKKFGRLKVIKFSHVHKETSHYLCKCDCKSTVIVNRNQLSSGKTSSCGCLFKETRFKHGKSLTPEYTIRACMIDRCHNPKNKGYKDYGARGIQVCERWRNPENGFKNFLEDMKERPDKTYSIDRINNDGNYEPNNCKWSTKKDQSRNQRLKSTNSSGYRGISVHKNKYHVRIVLNKQPKFIKSCDTLEEAIQCRINAELKYWGKIYTKVG